MIKNSYQIQVRQQHLKHDYSKVFKLKYRLSFDMCFLIQEYPDFCNFYYGDNRELFMTCTEKRIYRKLSEQLSAILI